MFGSANTTTTKQENRPLVCLFAGGESMPRIKMTIEYDGGGYHGFQRQDNAHTIQAELEKQIYRLSGETVAVIASSRTDAGVHARGQVIAFDTAARIPPERWYLALNSFLPADVRALCSSEADLNFNPQFQAASKSYLYCLYRRNEGAPFYRRYALCNTEKLDINAMHRACRFIIGHHNFKAFCASGATSKTFERTIFNCALTEDGPMLCLNIEGNGFLYNMVRIIMGTLLEVGRLRLPADNIPDIIEARDRTRAGPTVPPQGLYLMKVNYP